jgi:quinol monooxygenase YgiN
MSNLHRIVFACLLTAAVPALAPAQAKQEKPLHVVTYIDVFPQFTAGATTILHQFGADSLKDGATRFEVLQDTMRTNHLMIVEVWPTRQAYDKHLMADHSKSFREKLQPMLGSPFDERLSYLLP